jgi:hypothetical protein
MKRYPLSWLVAHPVCTENLIRVDAVAESPLMSVVNSRGNRLFSPRGTPTGFASRPKCAQGRR